MKYGYMRVSTQDKQEFTRQEFILKEYGLDRVFEEKISGTKKATTREAFNELLEVVKEGDYVYFESMSRMARSMKDLIDTTNFLVKNKKCSVIFIKENISIGGGNGLDSMGMLIFHIMGAFAQFERDLTSERTKQALAAKKEQGVQIGRKSTLTEEDAERIRELKDSGLSTREIATVTGFSKSTVARIISYFE